MKLLHENISPETLKVFRTVVFGTWFLIVLFDPFTELSRMPVSSLNPVGFLIRLLPVQLHAYLLTDIFLYGLKIILCVSLLLAIANKFFTVSTLIATVSLTFYQGFIRSFGHMNHAEMVLFYQVILITVFGLADNHWHKNNKGKKEPVNFNSIPFVFTIFYICLAYCFIGTRRLVYGGLELFQSDSLIYWIVSESNLPDYFSWHLEGLVLQHPWLQTILKLGFPVATMMEISAPFCLISRRFRIAFVAFMIPFHFFIWFFMQIFFIEYTIFYVLLFDINRWFLPKKASKKHPVVFYDGVCALCNEFVEKISAWDRTGVFHFAPLQGETAKEHLGKLKDDPKQWTVILADENGTHQRSEAVIRILSGLGGNGKFANFLRIVPVLMRDWSYEIVAKNRYQWFGKRDACRLPAKGELVKFLP